MSEGGLEPVIVALSFMTCGCRDCSFPCGDYSTHRNHVILVSVVVVVVVVGVCSPCLGLVHPSGERCVILAQATFISCESGCTLLPRPRSSMLESGSYVVVVVGRRRRQTSHGLNVSLPSCYRPKFRTPRKFDLRHFVVVGRRLVLVMASCRSCRLGVSLLAF